MFSNTVGRTRKFRSRPDLSCGRLRRSSLVSAVDRWTALADHSFPPRLNLRFWRPPSAAAACSLTRARKSGRRGVGCFIKVGAPGFEPGTSASRTQRSTELSHAPKFTRHRPENVPAGTRGRDHVRKAKRMGWDSPANRSAILSGLGGHLPDRTADHVPAPRLEPTTIADGVGFEPTRVLTHTISNRAP